MKIYPSLDVRASFYSLGNAWVVSLLGQENDVEQVFFGIYNLKGTHPNSKAGNLEWNADKTICEFNSSENLMFSFFYNLSQMRDESEERSNIFATLKIEELKQCQLPAQRISSEGYYNEYSTGKAKAENPDLNFNETVVLDGFRPRERIELDEDFLING